MSGIIAVSHFLVSLIFSLIIWCLWIRIALRYLRYSSLDPFNQLINTLTNPLTLPLHYILRVTYLPKNRFDWIAIIALLLIEFIKFITLGALVFYILIPFPYLCLFSLADLIIQPCNFLFYAVLFRVIMSYTNPNWRHPIAHFLHMVTNPLLVFGRKIVPNISGFDFSPIIIMTLLKVITLFISAYLPANL
jgi:YggT family protein